MNRTKDFALSLTINIALFSFLPLLHYLFHKPVSTLNPIQVEVIKLDKKIIEKKRKPTLVKLRQEKRRNPIKPDLRRRITFELAPNALASEVDFLAPFVTYDLSEVEQLPRLIVFEEPDYPFEAAAKGIEGVVKLKILIDRSGNIAMVKVLDNGGFYEFGIEAVRAVRQWRYEPAKIMGMPVAVWCVQNIRFEIK